MVLTHNKSCRFESRFVTVGIQASPSVWLAGMEGSALGVWVAHGEGTSLTKRSIDRLSLHNFTIFFFFFSIGLMRFRNAQVLDDITSAGLAPVRYLDDDSRPTEEYPLNPNGSPRGVAGLCSRDGRHLAMMPHPERCTLGWQWPWAPRSFRPQLETSPWLRMFRNAAAWCSQ